MVLYAIHKRLGVIKKITDYTCGWMNKTEWIIYEKFPNEQQYYNSVKEADWIPVLLDLDNSFEIESKGGD